jgi:hypothetical protein
LQEQFRLAQQKRFGASSEGHPGQGELFNEAEELVSEVTEPEQETISYTRNKPKRNLLPTDLPREVVVHDIDDADKVCACCENALHKIDEYKSEKLEFIPPQVKVIKHVRLITPVDIARKTAQPIRLNKHLYHAVLSLRVTQRQAC